MSRRVHVVGTSGSGKTTYAKRIAERMVAEHIELDALYWGPGWTPAETDAFRACVNERLSGDSWVVEGNYRVARDIIWGRADEIVWLDLPALVVWWRVITRTIRRRLTRETLWNGNRETWRGALFSWDSCVLWSIRTHFPRKKEYAKLCAHPLRKGITITRLRGRRAVEHDIRSRGCEQSS